MMKDKHSYLMQGITAFLVLSGAILVYFLLNRHETVFGFLAMVTRILRPIFMGMILAFLLLPVHRFFTEFFHSVLPQSWTEGKRMEKGLNFLSVLLSLLVAGLVIYLLLAMLLPQIYLSIIGFIENIPQYIREMYVGLQTFLQDNPELQRNILYYYNQAALGLEEWLSTSILPNLESVASLMTWMREEIMPDITGMVVGISSIVTAVTTMLTDIVVAVIVSFYLLHRKDIFAAHGKKIVYSVMPTKWGDLVVNETRSAYRIMSGFINGKLLDSFIIGIITFVCCNIFNFPYPTLVATIIGVTNVIPFFGPFIGAVPCSILICLVSPRQCVYFVIFILVLQQFDGNILGPKILGETTGLASFWVLFSILLFGGLFGFAGMVMGVPVFAMFYSIVRRLVYRGLRKRGLPIGTEEYVGKTGPLARAEKEIVPSDPT